MITMPNVKINGENELLRLPDFEGFMTALRSGLEELSKKIPGDGSLTVDINRDGRVYRIAVRMISSALKLFESDSSLSPFFALEKALLKTNDVLKVWAINRKF